jgi:hypothetical protein
MPKKKTSVDKPRQESAQPSPESDETIIEFVFGLGEDSKSPPNAPDGALAQDSPRKKTKKRSVFFKFTNNPG